MTFQAADNLWLLAAVAALVAAYLFVQLRRRPAAVRFSNVALVSSVAPRRPGWRRHLPAVVLLGALVAMVTALGRPSRVTRVARQRATVMMAIDVSESMDATDVKPSRLEAAKGAASAFVDRLPSRISLGLVSFSGVAQVLVPPTVDHALVKGAIGRLILAPRTAIGEAVYACLDGIAGASGGRSGGPVPARIVLMSDGETTVGRPNELAAEAAASAGVPVSTIAYGTEDGTVVIGTETIAVPVNKTALKEIATTTGGSFFEAASGEQLRRVYEGIGSAVGFETHRHEVTTLFVGLAFGLTLLAAAGSLLWSSRLV